jgi:SAM-dependent methyltransferase
VVEIGSGIGCTVKQFELAGFATTGVEPSAGFGRYSRDALRCRVRPGTWQDLPAVPQHDLVLLVHVLEHLRSPVAALTHIRKMVRPGGHLYVEVPNLAAPHAAPGQVYHFAHCYNFTPWTLENLLGLCGFQTQQSFGGERDVGIALLCKTSDSVVRSDPRDYERTIEALTRYGALGYHARPSYVGRRLAQVARYAAERVTASLRLRRILARCAAAPKAASADSRPARRGRAA